MMKCSEGCQEAALSKDAAARVRKEQNKAETRAEKKGDFDWLWDNGAACY